jgi:hypothetical protein
MFAIKKKIIKKNDNNLIVLFQKNKIIIIKIYFLQEKSRNIFKKNIYIFTYIINNCLF